MQSYVTYASDNDGEYEHFYCHYLFNMYWLIYTLYFFI